MDFLDILPCRSEAISDLLLRYDALERSDFADVFLAELGLCVLLATIVRAVAKSIMLVSLRRLPRQMALRDAALVASTARVCGFIVRLRRRPVDLCADHARDRVRVITFAQLPIPLLVAIRPDQALVTFVGEDDFKEVAARFAPACATTKRITVLSPPFIVADAPSALLREDRLATAWDRT